MWRETWLPILLLLCSMTACARPSAPPTVSPPPTTTIVLPSGTVIPGPAILDSPQEAQDLVSFTVLVPDAETLPAGLELTRVEWQPDPESRMKIVMLRYQSSGMEKDLYIQQLALSGKRVALPRQPHERIKVRDTTGYLLSHEGVEAYGLAWEEGGSAITISASGLTLEQTLRIVESMEAVRK